MKALGLKAALFFALLSLTDLVAQNNPYGDYGASTRRRTMRNCSQPYSAKFFNRDYPGLANSNLYHLDRELRDFVKFRCLTSEQIRRLAVLYQTDREKYDFLVYAFNYVYDLENYAMTGSVLANMNARDGFYRLLVREGVPAGDYYNQYAYYPPAYNVPVYPPTNNNRPYDNSYNNYPDPRYGTGYPQTPQYSDRNNNQPRPFDDRNAAPGPNPSFDNAQPMNGGYQGLMTYQEFEFVKEQVRQNAFDKGKLEKADALLRNNTLTANQVAEVTRLFSFDNNRLEFAKRAFATVYDRNNYGVVVDALSFDSNRKELRRFVEGKR